MADIDAMIREAERRSALQFDVRPKGPVIAQPYPRFREANAAASVHAAASRWFEAGNFSDAASSRSDDEIRPAHARSS